MQMMGMLLNNTLYYFNVWTKYMCAFNFFIGSSLMINIFLIICSYLFGFCNYHRLVIYSNIINVGIAIYDSINQLPINNLELLMLYYIVSTICILIALYLKFKTKCYERCNEIVSQRIKECCGQN